MHSRKKNQIEKKRYINRQHIMKNILIIQKIFQNVVKKTRMQVTLRSIDKYKIIKKITTKKIFYTDF